MPEMCTNCCQMFGGVAMMSGEDGIWRCPRCKAEFTMRVEAYGPDGGYNRKVFTRKKEVYA